MALGARPGQVRNMLVGDALTLTSAGLVIGFLLARGSTQALRSILFGVSAGDPLTFGGALALLLAVSLMSAWLPVRRAMRLDPVVALREV
jgi:ABC-type antimicrobial peptide transport system permease subunit